MNLKSVFSLRSVIGVTLVMAGFAHAADIKLSETTELQAEGDLTYTFAAGDTFVVDQSFSPTSFKPTCSGDFTMKVVEGSGSIAATTALDFSAVTGALTLSGLGTADSRLPAPTVASKQTINIESCWFSALTLTSSAGLTGVTYNVTGTGALGTLNGNQNSSGYTATLNLSGTQEITTVNSPYKSGVILWTVNVASGAQVTVTGTYDVGCTKLNLYGSLTCQGLFRTGWRSYQASDVYVYEGGSLICKEKFNFGNGYTQVPTLSIQGGTVEVAGTFTRANSTTRDRGQVGMSAGLLKVGALVDNNAGNSTNTDTLHFGCERSNKTNCLLTGGTLEVTGGTWTSKGPRFHTKGTAITIGADTTVAVEWVVHFAVSETLRGEGTIRTAKGAQSGLRQFVIDGEAADFTGTLNCAASSLVFGSASSGSFGGSATLEKNGEDVMLTIQRAGGVTVAGDVTLGDGVGLDLSAGGALTVGGTFTANGLVPVTLGEGVKDGFALVTLTTGSATDETAAKFTGVPEGYSVKAEGSAYVLRWDVSLPAVKPSEPEAGDEATYSTEASNALVAAAEAAQLSEVSQVLLQTKGAESASAPTVTEVNNVLGCFEGVVEATAETQTLTIRYEFGVADIAVDDSETPWNGKWQVTAKVEGPTGAAFAEGVTVAAYEVGEDGIIAEDAVPLAKTTIEAGTPVDSVVLRGLVLEGLGTHGVRVRVKATK